MQNVANFINSLTTVGLCAVIAKELIDQAVSIFSVVQRPEHFTDYQHCCECQEHDDTLNAFYPDTITRDALGTMGWDPITFATDQGFRYYLPGLIRIVLSEQGNNNYYEQFLWHIVGGGDYQRINACSESERGIVVKTLNFLLENREKEIEQECLEDDLLTAIEKWSDL